MKRALKISVILTCVLVITLNVLAFNHARSFTHFSNNGRLIHNAGSLGFWVKALLLFTGVKMPRPENRCAPSELSENSVQFFIQTSDNAELDAWYCNLGEESPLVILFHGYAGEKTTLLSEAQLFLKRGYSVLLVDFRGSGGSSESYTTVGADEAEDVLATYQFYKNHMKHKNVYFYGQSMGAAALLRAIHLYDVDPDAIIVEGVFDSMLSTVAHRFEELNAPSFPGAHILLFWGGCQSGFNPFKHNPSDYAVSVGCPALFLHGEDDPKAPLNEVLNVFNPITTEKYLVVFPDTVHEPCFKSNRELWSDSVFTFLVNYKG